MTNAPPEQDNPPIKSLTRPQRRVLGVLIEKAMTTPEYYPLTLKAVTSGSNQKNNRSPVTNYDEDQVEDALNQLRELGLVAGVHTESGRTERFRHWMRRRFTFTEAQLAILGELLLRGKQALGELRTRASRMIPIETQEQLRAELQGLLDLGLIRADGPLERRGAEVDHNWYLPGEAQEFTPRVDTDAGDTAAPPSRPAPAASSSPASAAMPAATGNLAELLTRTAALEKTCADLRNANQELRSDLESLQAEMRKLLSAFDDLQHSLGG